MIFALLCFVILFVLWITGNELVRDAGGTWQNNKFVPWGDDFIKGYFKWPHDKAWHTAGGIVVTGLSYVFYRNLPQAVLTASVCGAMLELGQLIPSPWHPYPYREHGYASLKDFAAVLLGAALVVGVVCLSR